MRLRGTRGLKTGISDRRAFSRSVEKDSNFQGEEKDCEAHWGRTSARRGVRGQRKEGQEPGGWISSRWSRCDVKKGKEKGMSDRSEEAAPSQGRVHQAWQTREVCRGRKGENNIEIPRSRGPKKRSEGGEGDEDWRELLDMTKKQKRTQEEEGCRMRVVAKVRRTRSSVLRSPSRSEKVREKRSKDREEGKPRRGARGGEKGKTIGGKTNSSRSRTTFRNDEGRAV